MDSQEEYIYLRDRHKVSDFNHIDFSFLSAAENLDEVKDLFCSYIDEFKSKTNDSYSCRIKHEEDYISEADAYSSNFYFETIRDETVDEFISRIQREQDVKNYNKTYLYNQLKELPKSSRDELIKKLEEEERETT